MTNSAYLDLPLRSLPRAIADRALAARDDVLGEAFSLCQIAGHADLFREVTAILRSPGGAADNRYLRELAQFLAVEGKQKSIYVRYPNGEVGFVRAPAP